MGRRKRLASTDRPALVAESDDSGLIGSFAVGPSGVGPVMGFRSDDFFPATLEPVGESQSADQPEDPVTPSVDRPIRGANARNGS